MLINSLSIERIDNVSQWISRLLSSFHAMSLASKWIDLRVLSGSLGAASADFKDIPAAAGRARYQLKHKMMFLGCFMLLPFIQ